jgi:hypothetical protein
LNDPQPDCNSATKVTSHTKRRIRAPRSPFRPLCDASVVETALGEIIAFNGGRWSISPP